MLTSQSFNFFKVFWHSNTDRLNTPNTPEKHYNLPSISPLWFLRQVWWHGHMLGGLHLAGHSSSPKKLYVQYPLLSSPSWKQMKKGRKKNQNIWGSNHFRKHKFYGFRVRNFKNNLDEGKISQIYLYQSHMLFLV